MRIFQKIMNNYLKGGLMKKGIIVMLIIVGCISSAAKKSKQEIEIPNIEAQME